MKKQITKDSLSRLVDLQLKVEKLPDLSPVEKAKFDQNIAIDQLYYSSRIEGTQLTKKMIDKAIHGKEIPSA